MNVQPGAGRLDSRLALAYVALAACFLASFMPWARVLFVTVNGTDGDGVLTLVLALAAAGLLFLWQRGDYRHTGLLFAALVATLVMTLVFVVDTVDVSRVASDSGSGVDLSDAVDIGAGLYLGGVASAASVLFHVALLARPPLAASPSKSALSSGTTDASATPTPVWDPQRSAWVSFDPRTNVWLRYDDATKQWTRLD